MSANSSATLLLLPRLRGTATSARLWHLFWAHLILRIKRPNVSWWSKWISSQTRNSIYCSWLVNWRGSVVCAACREFHTCSLSREISVKAAKPWSAYIVETWKTSKLKQRKTRKTPENIALLKTGLLSHISQFHFNKNHNLFNPPLPGCSRNHISPLRRFSCRSFSTNITKSSSPLSSLRVSSRGTYFKVTRPPYCLKR